MTAISFQAARLVGYGEPRQVLLTEYLPCGLKFGGAIKCTDVEMRFSRQASAFAGQCWSASGAKPAPGSSRRRIKLRDLALGDRI